jgi:hypothetical protein
VILVTLPQGELVPGLGKAIGSNTQPAPSIPRPSWARPAAFHPGPPSQVCICLAKQKDLRELERLFDWSREYEKKIVERTRSREEEKKAARVKRMGGPLRGTPLRPLRSLFSQESE